MNTSDLITAYLAASGWTKSELARRAKLSPSAIARLLHGRKSGGATTFTVGRLVAQSLERATLAAFERGETRATPLRADDLLACNATKQRAA